MTSRIIYHDFQGNNPTSTMTKPEPAIVLTAPLLMKGRQRAKTLARVDTAVKAACVALNLACIGVGAYIIYFLMTAGM